MFSTVATYARKLLMLLFTLAALADGSQTWADVESGNAKIPVEYLPAVQLIFPECATEDSTWCHWDGGENGKGYQFISLGEYVIIFD